MRMTLAAAGWPTLLMSSITAALLVVTVQPASLSLSTASLWSCPSLEAQQSSVDTMIDTLESVTTTKDIKIKVKYLNSDGSVLGEKEFKKS